MNRRIGKSGRNAGNQETPNILPVGETKQTELRSSVLEALAVFGERTLSYEGGHSGPSILLIGGTHGNEILGVLVADMFRRQFESGELSLISGTMRLMLGNTHAIELNERTVPGKDDLNRIMVDEVLNGSAYPSWEADRARRIATVIQESDITIDLHSTNNPSRAFVCSTNSPQHREIYKWLPRTALVTDPERLVSRGGRSIDEYADDCGKIGINFESGQATDMSNVIPVFESIKAILIERGMLEGSLPKPFSGTEYRVAGFVPHDPENAFTFVEGKESGFTPVSYGEVIGYRALEPVLSPVDGVILFPKKPEHQAKDGVVTFFAVP